MGRPPVLARLLLGILTPRAFRTQVLGDVLEGFRRVAAERGVTAARGWYWRQLMAADVFTLHSVVRRRSQHERRVNQMRVLGWSADVQYAFRMMRKRPGVSLAVIATLAMGIGATTAMFSLINGVLLRPLPYERSDDLVMVFRTVPRYDLTRSVVSYPDFVDWRAEVEAFDALAAYGPTRLTYLAGTEADEWRGYRITADLMPLLGVEPHLGRWPAPAEDRPGADAVILLGYNLWQTRFAGTPDILGRALTLGDESHTVIGVMPPDFDFPARQIQFWVPLRADPVRWERDTNFLTVIGRLAPGMTVDDAHVQLVRVASRIDRASPGVVEGFGEGYGVSVESRLSVVVQNARSALLVFLGAVGLLLAIACANVANLMLVRGTERRRELAVRSALGAGRLRLVRQLLIEALLLAGVGGALGALTAFALVRGVIVFGPELPRASEVAVDPVALLFTGLVSLASGIVVGVVPAVIATRQDTAESIKEGAGPVGLSRAGLRIQQGFVVGQVAVAIVLVVGAGLLISSFDRLSAVTPGFDPSNVVAARVTLPRPVLDDGPPQSGMQTAMDAWAQERNRFLETVAERVSGAEGASRVGIAYGIPFGRHTFSRPVVAEGAATGVAEAPSINGNIIAGDYFAAMGIPLVRGRPFDRGDALAGPPVLIVSQSAADLLWPGADPLGRRVRLGNTDDGPWVTVVGVASDVRLRSLADDPEPMYYRPLRQVAWPDGMFVVVRSTRPAGDVLDVMRRAVWDLNPSLPVTDVATTRDLVDDTLAVPRFRATVLAGFGVVAVGLAVLGIYAVMAYSVGRQAREIGIRMALGASGSLITRRVLATGSALTVIGSGIGIVLALGLTRFLSGMLFGLGPRDPWTFVGSVLAFGGVAVLACWVPARRAARLDPVGVLKE